MSHNLLFLECSFKINKFHILHAPGECPQGHSRNLRVPLRKRFHLIRLSQFIYGIS